MLLTVSAIVVIIIIIIITIIIIIIIRFIYIASAHTSTHLLWHITK